MSIKLVNVAKVSAIAMVLALSAGCASTDAVKKAQASADAANAAAAQAQATADAAMRASEENKACCNDVNEKIDRMFKKSMNK